MYVTKEAIEQVRRAHDLVEVVWSRGVALRRKGRNWVGLCPFHDDHEPTSHQGAGSVGFSGDSVSFPSW